MPKIIDKPIRFVVNGERWTRRNAKRIRRNGKPCDGLCVHLQKTVKIAEDQASEREAFNTDIHEAIHAWCPEFNEEVVLDMADEMTALFFDKLRYRRLPSD